MSYSNFPSKLYIKTIDTGEDILLGGYKLVNHTELVATRFYFYIDGGTPTNETMKLEIHRNAACTVKAFESNVVSLSSIPNLSSRWQGWIRFDFDRKLVNKNFYWYPKLVMGNYTRTPEYYIGALLDWPVKSNPNANTNPLARALKLEFIGYK